MRDTKEIRDIREQIADIEFMLKSDAEAEGGYLA